MMETMNQRCTSFQSVMLQTMKELVIQMIPQLSNQQRSNLLSPSPHDMLHTQPPTYHYQGAVLNHYYPPQTTPHYPLTNIPPPLIHLPPPPYHLFISHHNPLDASINQMLPPLLPPSQSSATSNLPQFQISFENAMTEIDADL